MYLSKVTNTNTLYRYTMGDVDDAVPTFQEREAAGADTGRAAQTADVRRRLPVRRYPLKTDFVYV